MSLLGASSKKTIDRVLLVTCRAVSCAHLAQCWQALFILHAPKRFAEVPQGAHFGGGSVLEIGAQAFIVVLIEHTPCLETAPGILSAD